MTRRGERGAASLFAVACLAVLLLLGAALGVVAAMVRAHRVAQSAADLGAWRGRGPGRGRDRARRRPDRRGQRRRAACCALRPRRPVTVEVAGPRWLGQPATCCAGAGGADGPQQTAVQSSDSWREHR